MSEVTVLINELTALCTKVPPAINRASIDVVRGFKADIEASKKLLKKRGVKTSELLGAINNLSRHHK